MNELLNNGREKKARWKEATRTIYASALLLDGKILFWKTGDNQRLETADWYKEWWRSGMDEDKMREDYTIESVSMGFIIADKPECRDFVFLTMAEMFFKQYQMSPYFKGFKPYD